MLPPSELREILEYHADTGELRWKRKISRKVVVGGLAGTVNMHGYVQLKVAGVQYKAHRVAWALHYGEWPDGGIDHIDGNGLNNAISNLRAADQQQNLQNARRRSDNKSGHAGVSWYKKTSSWRADITIAGKSIYLGSFHAKGEAIAAYLDAKRKNHTFNPIPRKAP